MDNDEYARPTIHAERAGALVRDSEGDVADHVPQVLEACDMLTEASDTLQSVVDRLENRLAPVLNPMSYGTAMREAEDKEPERASLAQRVRNTAEFVTGQAGRPQQLLDRLEV